MPWIDVEEPHAEPPRLSTVNPPTVWSAPFSLDHGWAEFADVQVTHCEPSLVGVTELHITNSHLDEVTLASEDEFIIEAHRSTLTNCDVSGLTFRSLRATSITGSKLAGTDFSAADIRDVCFERCSFRYVNLRMAKLERVAFVDCTLDDIDAFEAELHDIDFIGSSLAAVNIDRVRAERVDLRGATSIGLDAVGRLGGFLVTEQQLAALAHTLAFANGLGVERT